MFNFKMDCLVRASVSCLFFLSSASLAQTQLGSDLQGNAEGDQFGRAVAMSADGHRMAVGSPRSMTDGSATGVVRVFQWSDGTWTRLGQDIAGEMDGERFGYSVAFSAEGTRLAVGATLSNSGGQESGAVRVFQWSGSAWSQLGPEIAGEDAADASGRSVAISADGSRVAIGAHFADPNQAGHVRVFDWNGSDWEQAGSDIDGAAFEDMMGNSVALSADGAFVAVGAPQSIWNGAPGYVQVYRWSGSDWSPLGNRLVGDSSGDGFGWAVSLNTAGDRLAVGAVYKDGNGADSGQVRVFELNGDAWSQSGSDINGEFSGDQFGHGVALSASGERLVVGAHRNSENGDAAGHVRVFSWQDPDWVQLGSDVDGAAAGDWFGYRVALSGDGNRFSSGAPFADNGYVRAYSLNEFNPFTINAGLNDAWFASETDGQGFLIAAFPATQRMFVAWFTFETERPGDEVTSRLGDPGHRWLVAEGPYVGDTANMTVYVSKGGVFNSPLPPAVTDPAGDGTLVLEFADCMNAIATYNITSLGISGEIPIERVAPHNVPLCEELGR